MGGWFGARRRTTPGTPGTPTALASVEVEVLAADAVRRALPRVEDLQATAIDRPGFREGAEAMRAAVLEVLRSEFPACGCHPVWHELGVHAPVGDARTVTP